MQPSRRVFECRNSNFFLCMMVTNCRAEKRTDAMLQERLTSLSWMFTERHMLKEIDFEEVIIDSTNKKSRKVPLVSIEIFF